MAMAVPRPGSIPTAVPMVTPMSAMSRLPGVRIAPKPSIRELRFSIAGPS
jgi:hypothetical protein